MQAANRLQTALKKGASFGAWHMLVRNFLASSSSTLLIFCQPGTNLARQMASTGLDWILVDCEHGNIADAQMHESVTAIAAMSVSPIVRIPSTEPWMIKRALDAGAHGVMVPLLETAAQARDIVKAAKFPPLGRRGFGSPFPQAAFKGVDTGVQYLQEANEGLVTVMQIETKEALANVEEIARVDGVDVLFVGPFDLGNNIGHPYIGTMHDNLRDAIAKIHKAAHDAGKKSGIYCTSGTQAREYADMGFEMVSPTAQSRREQG